MKLKNLKRFGIFTGITYTVYAICILLFCLLVQSRYFLDRIYQLAINTNVISIESPLDSNFTEILIPPGQVKLTNQPEPLFTWQQIKIRHDLYRLVFFHVNINLKVEKPLIDLRYLESKDAIKDTKTEPTSDEKNHIPSIFSPIPIEFQTNISQLEIRADESKISSLNIEFKANTFLNSLDTKLNISSINDLSITFHETESFMTLNFELVTSNLETAKSYVSIRNGRIKSPKFSISNLEIEQKSLITLTDNLVEFHLMSFSLNDIIDAKTYVSTPINNSASHPFKLISNIFLDQSKLPKIIEEPVLPHKLNGTSKIALDLDVKNTSTIHEIFKSAEINIETSIQETIPIQDRNVNTLIKIKGQSTEMDHDINLSINFGTQINIDLKTKIGRLLKSLNSSLYVSLPNISQVNDIMKPIFRRFLPLDIIPKELHGSILVKQNAHLLLNSSLHKDINKHLDNLSITGQTRISNLSTSIDNSNLNIKGYNFILSNHLTNRSLSLSLAHNAKNISASIQQNRISISSFKQDINTLTSISKNLAIANSYTELSMRTYIEDIKSNLIDLRKLDNNVILKANSNKINLDIETLSINSMGLNLNSQILVDLKEYMPINSNIFYNLEMDSEKASKALTNFDSSGILQSSGSISIIENNRIKFDINNIFENFSIKIGQKDSPILLVKNINGHLPLKHALSVEDLDKPTDSSATDEHINALLLTSYSSISESFSHYKELTIDEVKAKGIVCKNISMTPVLSPKSLRILEMRGHVLGGSFRSSLTVNLNPIPTRADITFNFSDLDSHLLLVEFPKLLKKLSGWGIGSNPEISGRISMNIDLTTLKIDGSIDLTEIGKEQLKAIMYFIDPHQKNASITLARKTLVTADVNYVSIPIKNGFMGFDVGLSILAVPVPIPKMQGFPISQVLSNFKQSATREEGQDEI